MTWVVRAISDVRGILDADVTDGTEVYSSFVGPELAAVLLTPRQSPLQAWDEANPDKDSNDAIVGEILGSWDKSEGGGTAS